MLIALILAILLFLWLKYDPSEKIIIAVPGLDKPDSLIVAANNEIVEIGSYFNYFQTFGCNLTEIWPGFRGESRDNIASYNNFVIPKSLESKNIAWTCELGEGHASPAIYNGKVFILDYDENNRMDLLRCFSLTDGKEIWQRGYKVYLKRNHGMSRTIPYVTDKYLVSIGPKGHVMCLDPNNGNFLWGLDLKKKYNSEIPFWYTGQCPLIDKETLVLATGGQNLLIGVDCKTGKVVWESQNPMQWKMSHSSVMKIEIEKVEMYVYAAIGGVVGISADKNNIGEILWQTSEWNPSVIAPSPLYIGNGNVLVTAGYGAGSAIIHIQKNKNLFHAEILKKLKPSEGLASEQQTPILHNGLVYCILPKDAGTMKNQLACYKPDNLNIPVWSSGKTRRFGLGPYFILNNTVFVLNDDGVLSLVKTGTIEYTEVFSGKLFVGQDAWGPFAFANGFLLMRDSKHLFCLNLN